MMIIFWSFIAFVVILFGLVLWSYVDDLKKADEYYPSSDDLNKFFEGDRETRVYDLIKNEELKKVE
jgi:hypothetical protein